MSIDELIALVDKRDSLEVELHVVRKELERQNIAHGIYRGTGGRLVRVTEHPDHPRQFGTMAVRDELRYS